MNNIYQILAELGIDYKKYDHPAVFDVNEADIPLANEFGRLYTPLTRFAQA